jgi:hypothetical protein
MLITVNRSLFSGGMPSSRKRIKREHPLQWLIEPLMGEPSSLEKPMFGCQACYLHGRLALVVHQIMA